MIRALAATACGIVLVLHSGLERLPFETTARADEAPAPVVLPRSALPPRWSLSDQQLDAFIRRYQALHGDPVGAMLEEVTVQSPAELRMRDLSQDIWGGPAAPFWALMHPTQSWRIFLPVPPKDAPAKDSGE